MTRDEVIQYLINRTDGRMLEPEARVAAIAMEMSMAAISAKLAGDVAVRDEAAGLIGDLLAAALVYARPIVRREVIEECAKLVDSLGDDEMHDPGFAAWRIREYGKKVGNVD